MISAATTGTKDIKDILIDYAILADPVAKIDSGSSNFIIKSFNQELNENISDNTIIPRKSTINIINNNKSSISMIQKSNTLKLHIPKYLFTIKEIKTTVHPKFYHNSDGEITNCEPTVTNEIIYNEFEYGSKFIIVYMSINMENPKIIGVVEDD